MTGALATQPAEDIPGLLGLFSARGERPALSFYRGKALAGRLTYAELWRSVGALARVLSGEFSVCPGDRIAVLSPNRLEVPVLLLALLDLGATVVPLNPAASPAEWAFALGHCGARGLCVTQELQAQVAPLSGLKFVLPLEGLLARTPPAGADARRVEGAPGEQLAVVLYTSGTTGSPKGVALKQRHLCANAWSLATSLQLDAVAQLAVLPLSHAHALGFGLMTSLLTGGHLVFTERIEPFTWAALIRAEAIAVASVVPTLLPLLVAAGVTQERVPTLRHLLVSSAPLSAAVARDFEARTRIALLHGWGLSEYTNFACCIPARTSAEERAFLLYSQEVPSIGPALAGSEVRILAERGETASEGQRGELSIRGHSTMAGYLGDPEGTARTLDADGWLRTGDEGFFLRRHGQSVYFVTGRIKEIIIRDGEKYSPIGIERRLLEDLPELVGQLVVLGFPHQSRGEEVGAYLQRETIDPSLRLRIEAALQALTLGERPKVVLHGAQLIARTHTGKVQRRRMQAWFAPWAAHRGPVVIASQASPALAGQAATDAVSS